MTMSSLKYTSLWLVFLLVHLDIEIIHCATLTIKTCPPIYSFECPPEVDNSCYDDQDCEASYPGEGYKCCNECGRSCVPPDITFVKVKSTTTPKPTPNAKIRFTRVKTNAPKLVAKCPTSPPSSEFPPGPDQECQNDTSCDAKFPGQVLKCCSDGCDFKCITPVMESNDQIYEVQGTCPISLDIVECQRQADDECQADSECRDLYPGQELKCCKDGCDRRCVSPDVRKIDTKTDKSASSTRQQTTPSPTTKPVTKQQSTFSPTTTILECPAWPPPGGCPPEPDDECNNDEICSESYPGLGLKCCLDGCAYRCMSPVIRKIDTKTDKSASSTRQQTTPSPTTKPVTKQQTTSSPTTTILECPAWPPPGGCPPEPDDECHNDEKCSESYPGLGLKCCLDGCAYRCVPPVVRKIDTKTDKYPSSTKQQTTLSPTTKPVTKQQITSSPTITILECPHYPPPAECPPEPDHECRNDENCRELHPGLGLKCCRDGCDYRCVPPVVRKIDTKTDISARNSKQQTISSPTTTILECPVWPPPAECPGGPDHECNDDEKCNEYHPGLGLICCIDGCDRRCVPPVVRKIDTKTDKSPSSTKQQTTPSPTTKPVTKQQTTSPQKSKILECPAWPPPGGCPPEPDDECNNDERCSELHPGLGLKCCLDGCDYRCVPPLVRERDK